MSEQIQRNHFRNARGERMSDEAFGLILGDLGFRIADGCSPERLRQAVVTIARAGTPRCG
jgi:hypothetical protein